jgi:hypothetical protein
MPITPYPQGVSSFGVPLVGGGLIPLTGGSYFWVDSNYAGGNGAGTFDSPFSTVANALTACTASAGDVIIMKQGHAESIVAAAGWACSKIGVTIVGLGAGALKPLITLKTSAAATILVSAASVTFINFDTTTAVDELVTTFDVEADSCALYGVNYRETSASYQSITWLTTTTAGTNLTVDGCRLKQVTACAGNGFAITLTGADDARITNNFISWLGTDNAGSGSIGMKTTACLRVFIANNYCINMAGTTGVSILAVNSSSGLIANNRSVNPNAAGSIVLADGCGGAENYVSAVTKGGTLDPAA